MPSSASSRPHEALYLRFHGQAVGPYPLAQLRQMLDAGHLAPVQDVSLDGRTWATMSLPGLLYGAGGTPPPPTAAVTPAHTPEPEPAAPALSEADVELPALSDTDLSLDAGAAPPAEPERRSSRPRRAAAHRSALGEWMRANPALAMTLAIFLGAVTSGAVIWTVSGFFKGRGGDDDAPSRLPQAPRVVRHTAVRTRPSKTFLGVLHLTVTPAKVPAGGEIRVSVRPSLPSGEVPSELLRWKVNGKAQAAEHDRKDGTYRLAAPSEPTRECLVEVELPSDRRYDRSVGSETVEVLAGR